jgi:hypothetical protein
VAVGQGLLHRYRSGMAGSWGGEDILAIARVMDYFSPPEK